MMKMDFAKISMWVSALLLSASITSGRTQQPHIIFIMADDMGWNDVSYHGSDQILTPNIDALAYSGVALQQYYSEPICTPARTALLTGKYPSRLGMQSMPLYNSEDRAIPLEERLLPSYLKALGYSTHLVGKWHVGMSRPQYLPTRRGFDTHYGIRGGFVDYYTYNKIEEWPNGRVMYGQDLFDDMEVLSRQEGYLTDLLTDRAIEVIRHHNASRPLFLQVAHGAPHAGNAGAPLQPPPRAVGANFHIAYSDRRLYADMVQSLDDSVGRVVSALADKGILNDSLIVFVSDNGAPSVGMYSNLGVNLPFRGIKHTPWEGAVRVPAILYHPSLKPRVWDGLMHITDWLPTLVAAAGGKVSKAIDGVNQWEVIVKDKESRRGEVLVALDDMINFAAYRLGDYKIVVGNVTGLRNEYYGEDWMELKSKPPPYLPTLRVSEVSRVLETVGRPLDAESVKKTREEMKIQQLDSDSDHELCVPSPKKGCLFNIRQDPQERHDLWDSATKIAQRLVARLQSFWTTRKPRTQTLLYEEADPGYNHYTWMPWLDGKSSVLRAMVAWRGDMSNSPFPKMSGAAFLNVTCLSLMKSNPARLKNWTEMSENQKISSIYSGQCIQYE